MSASSHANRILPLYTSDMSLRDQIRGVLGFPITPFRKDLSLDLDALARNVDEMASHPFCALVAAGGTAVHFSLPPEEVDHVLRGSLVTGTWLIALCVDQVY